jgi:hypothetical protein
MPVVHSQCYEISRFLFADTPRILFVMAQSVAVKQSTQNESVTETVVSAVAEFTESDQASLEPLYSVVDPDALNRLFVPPDGPPSDWHGRISFHYSNSLVTIDLAESSIEVTTPPAAVPQ